MVSSAAEGYSKVGLKTLMLDLLGLEKPILLGLCEVFPILLAFEVLMAVLLV